jgi:FtsX-like permease family protein/MacB-like protein
VTGAWLGWRDVAARRGRATLAVIIVAACAAVLAAAELVESARDAAVGAQLDSLAPPLRVLPRPGPSDADAKPLLTSRDAERVRDAGGSAIRAVEPWIAFDAEIAGTRARLVGAPPGSPVSDVLSSPDLVALGAALAERLRIGPGARISVAGRLHRAIVLPPRGDADDASAFVPIAQARETLGIRDAVSELRVRLWPGVPVKEMRARLTGALPDASVVVMDRGAVADVEIGSTLQAHHRAIALLAAIVTLLCLAIVAQLDAAERRLELALLAALGACRRDLVVALATRSMAIAIAGAVSGVALGAMAAASAGEALAVLRATPLLLVIVAVTGALLGLMSAMPAAALATSRDPIRDLQEASS